MNSLFCGYNLFFFQELLTLHFVDIGEKMDWIVDVGLIHQADTQRCGYFKKF